MQASYSTAPSIPQARDQYTFGAILAIWAVVALPMFVLAWIVGPAIFPFVPLPPPIVHWLLMIVGMIWQFVVAVIILRRELGSFRWALWRERLWLNRPRDPRTGRPDARLFWWIVPCLLFSPATAIISSSLDSSLVALFPALAMPPQMDAGSLADPQFVGWWWLLGIALISNLFNYVLGEELLFRGVLLPKMHGAFGKWDWAANAVLFGLYHLHKPWALPGIIIGSLAISWPAARFRSNWMALIVHGSEGILVLVVVLSVILGVAV